MALVSDILDVSRIEAGKVDISARPFDLADILDAVVEGLRPQAMRQGLALDLDLDPRLPERLLGDPERLRQVAMNLVGNAVKFTEAGSVHVAVWITHELPDGPCLVLVVADTGIGIPAERIDDVFGTFTQVDGSPTRRYQGTGLGLAIVRQLVGLMGGSICVESGVGRGTTIYTALCLAAVDDFASQEPGASADAAPAPERPLKVLVAEDNPVNQIYALDQLEIMGHTAVLAEDGSVALQLLAEHGDFDLVLMDVQMPNMDGVEATRRIRAGEVPGVAADLPIVAVTAHALKGDREAFLEAGMDDYVSKPIAENALRTVLARVAAKGA